MFILCKKIVGRNEKECDFFTLCTVKCARMEELMSDQCNQSCSSCSAECKDRKSPNDFRKKPHAGSRIKKVIGVVSGKGGVGKSLVTSLLAVAYQQKGMKTAVLDADITGPSIPKVFGITEKAKGSQEGIYPVESEKGIKVISVNLLLENETDPVIWRGPMIANMVQQFWTDVIWGDIDVLLIDMPPGTGDVPLTVFQSIPIDGIVVVTSPQELVSMIVSKAVHMAEKMNVPILGLVENMSYFCCPDCGREHTIFGKSHIEETAKQFHIQNVVKLPIDRAIAKYCDNGKIELFQGESLKRIAEGFCDLTK